MIERLFHLAQLALAFVSFIAVFFGWMPFKPHDVPWRGGTNTALLIILHAVYLAWWWIAGLWIIEGWNFWAANAL